MGRLLEGKWITQDLGTDAQGRYVRRATQFRNGLDGLPFRKDDLDFTAPSQQDIKRQRFLLVIGSPCGWSHRVLLVRALLGLEQVLPVVYSDAFMGDDGWTFYQHSNTSGDADNERDDKKGGITAQELFLNPSKHGYQDDDTVVQKMHQLYTLAQTDYTGRASVPVLWDRQQGTIVNNESSDLIYLLANNFKAYATRHDHHHLLPSELLPQIQAMMDANYMPINNGVYRCGFASSQAAYDEAATALFQRLDELEALLETQRYLCGNQLTMADVGLFPTLYRFDSIYYTHFKCNLKHIYEYPNLWGWLRDVYQQPDIAATCDMEACKTHYYTSHESIHPRRYIPLCPRLDFDSPHGRDTKECAESATA